jgi:hypothetical protein
MVSASRQAALQYDTTRPATTRTWLARNGSTGF